MDFRMPYRSPARGPIKTARRIIVVPSSALIPMVLTAGRFGLGCCLDRTAVVEFSSVCVLLEGLKVVNAGRPPPAWTVRFRGRGRGWASPLLAPRATKMTPTSIKKRMDVVMVAVSKSGTNAYIRNQTVQKKAPSIHCEGAGCGAAPLGLTRGLFGVLTALTLNRRALVVRGGHIVDWAPPLAPVLLIRVNHDGLRRAALLSRSMRKIGFRKYRFFSEIAVAICFENSTFLDVPLACL